MHYDIIFKLSMIVMNINYRFLKKGHNSSMLDYLGRLD